MNKPIRRAFLDNEDGQILYRIGGEGEPYTNIGLTHCTNEHGMYLRK